MDIAGIEKNMEKDLNKTCLKHLHHIIAIILIIIIKIATRIENSKSLKCKIEIFSFF